MSGAEGKIEIRPLVLGDLDTILSIDRKIRAVGEAITYANLTTAHIFTADRKVGRQKRPTSYYVSLITGDVAGLLEFSLVAEIDGHVCGFVLGDIGHVGETATKVGLILIIGVHPDYQRKGIAAKLVNALAEKCRSKGIQTIRIEIDQRDKELLGFADRMGFSVGHLVDYSKTL